MRTVRLALCVAPGLLVAGCAFLTRTSRPLHAPESEAAKVKFPFGVPRERVLLSGAWLHAVSLAMDDFLPEATSAETTAQSSKWDDVLAACLSRRESYYAEAWAWTPSHASGGDGGEEVDGLDAGSPTDADAGDPDPYAQPGMPKAPPVIYVSIGLLPNACNVGESPLVDGGAVYAIDTVGWRILAIHH